MRIPHLAIAAAAAGAITTAAPAQIAPVAPLAADATRLAVTATGEARRVPDIATIRAGVVTQAATAQAALSENARRMTATIAALRDVGVAERDISTAAIRLQPQYRYGENQPPVLTGYEATNSVEVRFRDIARSGAILDALVARGANQIDGPTLSLDEPDAALDEARRDAIRRARERAALYAQATGLRVGRIVSIDEGGEAGAPAPMMRAQAMRVSADAQTPVLPGEQTRSVTVNVVFELR